MQVVGRHAVTLDDVAITQVPRPCGPVQHERVNTLPLVADGFHGHELAVLPLQSFALALDGALQHGVGERDDVVEKLVERFVPAAFGQLVFHLAFHAAHALVGLFLEQALCFVFHGHGHLAQLILRRWHATLLDVSHQLLGQCRLQLLENFRWHCRLWRTLDAPWLVSARTQKGIAQPAGGRAALDRGQVDEDV